MSKTEIYICAKYAGKIIHARQIEIDKALADGVVDLITKQIDGMIDTLIKAEKKKFWIR